MAASLVLVLEIASASVAGYYGANLLFVLGGRAIGWRAAKLRPLDPEHAELFDAPASVLERVRGTVYETWCQTRVVHADMRRRVLGSPRVPPLSSGTPVLLLPGYLESTGAMASLGRWLRREGFRVVLDEFPSTFRPIADNAAYVRERVQALRAETGAERVAIVAHSMGGVVARSMIHSHPEDHGVAVLVCLGSPHQGVTFRVGAPGRSARDMVATSPLMRELAERPPSGVPVHTVVGMGEQIVSPPWATVTGEGEVRVLAGSLGHFGPLFDGDSRRQIQQWLLDAGVEVGADSKATAMVEATSRAG